MGRMRFKIAATVDRQTIAVLDDILKRNMAKSQSEALDILANNYLLTQGIGSHDTATEIIQSMKGSKAIILRDLEKDLDELITSIVNQKMAEEMVKKPVKRYDSSAFEELLTKCPDGTASATMGWAEGWSKEIEATGHTIDEFVAEKVMMVSKATEAVKTRPERTGSIPQGETGEMKWVRHTAEAMVQYWRTYLNNDALQIESKMFQVARYSKAVQGLVEKMDNGHREEYLMTLVDRLRDDAGSRKWNQEKYVNDWKTIYDNAKAIISRNTGEIKG